LRGVDRGHSLQRMLSTEFALPPDGTATVAQSPEYLRAKVKAQIIEGKPTFFKFEAQLPKGRTDTPLAASDKMWVVLKTYGRMARTGCTLILTKTTPLSCFRAKRPSTARLAGSGWRSPAPTPTITVKCRMAALPLSRSIGVSHFSICLACPSKRRSIASVPDEA
jgi:hypothetical protein